MDSYTQVYWNVRKCVWSLRVKGKVVSHKTTLTLKSCRFVVSQNGQARCRRQKTKNVHAWIEGFLCNEEVSLSRTVTYNPYKHDTFVFKDTLEPIVAAECVYFTVEDGKPLVWVK